VILGTAGHIDHGKTALVRALTGVDTDRLKEEKARGITIELGFAHLNVADRAFGVVDVPGHEAFVRAMVAGAAGMDVVLLVVAADEGVMPQTREHLAIVDLLGVPEVVVAITKCDAVEDEWLELVDADIESLLAGTRYHGAPRVRTSALRETGLETLVEALSTAASRIRVPPVDDLTRLPLDRVFTIQGTGTVVTGTLWTGELRTGDRVRILPQGLEARVRAIQVHERETDVARAGDRTAVALTGAGADRDVVSRGSTLVVSPDWQPTWMLTAKVRLLADSEWSLAHNQRVHVHHGTAEVLARCALLEHDEIRPGAWGWVQLRLEEPVAARARDRFVVRAYSPVATIGGGVVAEAMPPKRSGLDEATRSALAALVDGTDRDAVAAVVQLQGWQGAVTRGLPVLTGVASRSVEAVLSQLDESGFLRTAERVYAAAVRVRAEEHVIDAVRAGHTADALRASVPLSAVRSALPRWAPGELADAVVTELVRDGRLESASGGVRLRGHHPTMSEDQKAASARLEAALAHGGLGAPSVDELPDDLRARKDFWSLVHRLEELGLVRQVADGLYLGCAELDAAESRIREQLGGREDLGPADFRDVLPVTRKRLIPLLNYFDGRGTTVRGAGGRAVPA
jgi:selenocysteine-specific elongation factor